MDIERVFEYLPDPILDDIYFQNIMEIIIRDFKKFDARIIFQIASSLNIPDCQDSDAVLRFLYYYDDTICSLGIRKEQEEYNIYFEVESSDKYAQTILVKSPASSSIREVSYNHHLGVMSNYNLNALFYDADYNPLPNIDIEKSKDSLFSTEFNIPVYMARLMRQNFNNYAEALSRSHAESKMRKRDLALKEKELFYFTEPFILHDMKEFFVQASKNDNSNVIRDILHTDSPEIEIPCLYRIDKVLTKLKTIIGTDSLIIMSDNLFQNIKPVLYGLEADGYDTKGIIIKKDGELFQIYYVHIMSDKVEYNMAKLSFSDIETIFSMNEKNALVPGLKEFFGINRNL